MPITSERIQNMIEKEEPPLYKPERYTSKFKADVIKECKENKNEHKTMGNAIEIPPFPNEFLKRHSASARKCNQTSMHHEEKCLLSERRPPIPKGINPSRQNKTCRDFLNENKRRVVAHSHQPKQKFVDTYRGNVQNVENSGLRPRYVFKTNYGHLPQYVTEYKQKKKENLEENEKSIASTESDFKMHTKLSDEKREKLLKGLKKNLEEKNHKFLLLPVIIDTPYLINYKRRLEKTIVQLEKDILNIEQHPVIYITK